MRGERPESRRAQSRPSAAEIAKWDDILKADATERGETILTHQEETQGLAGADVEVEDLTALEPDEVRSKEIAIAQAIATEPGHRLFRLPGNQAELTAEIMQLCKQIARSSATKPDIYVHSSCVTGEPCVCVCLPAKHPQAGEVLHLPTVRMDDFSFDALSSDFEELGISIGLKGS